MSLRTCITPPARLTRYAPKAASASSGSQQAGDAGAQANDTWVCNMPNVRVLMIGFGVSGHHIPVLGQSSAPAFTHSGGCESKSVCKYRGRACSSCPPLRWMSCILLLTWSNNFVLNSDRLTCKRGGLWRRRQTLLHCIPRSRLGPCTVSRTGVANLHRAPEARCRPEL